MAFKGSSWFVCCHDSQYCPFLSSSVLFPSFSVWGFRIAWRIPCRCISLLLSSPVRAQVQEQCRDEQPLHSPCWPSCPPVCTSPKAGAQLCLAGPWPWLLPATPLCPLGLGGALGEWFWLRGVCSCADTRLVLRKPLCIPAHGLLLAWKLKIKMLPLRSFTVHSILDVLLQLLIRLCFTWIGGVWNAYTMEKRK